MYYETGIISYPYLPEDPFISFKAFFLEIKFRAFFEQKNVQYDEGTIMSFYSKFIEQDEGKLAN